MSGHYHIRSCGGHCSDHFFFSTLKAAVDYYKEALDRISAELAQKQAKLTEVQIRRQQMEQEIAVLQDTYNCVAKSLQEAKIARAETAESNCGTARPTHYSCGAK